MRTRLVNETQKDIIVNLVSGGDTTKLSIVEPKGEYTINTDEDVLSRQYSVTFKGTGNAVFKFSSDELVDVAKMTLAINESGQYELRKADRRGLFNLFPKNQEPIQIPDTSSPSKSKSPI
jgi:hypothetical protein